MLPTFANHVRLRGVQCLLLVFILNAALLPQTATAVSYEGDDCRMKSRPGVCTLNSKCPSLRNDVSSGEVAEHEIVRCGYGTYEEIICCPFETAAVTPTPTAVVEPASTAGTPVNTRTSNRPAVQACNAIEEGLRQLLTPHIIGGIRAEIGEFPHMAAIGYRRIGNDREYDFRCGGTLIAKRFVLTAAHCVNNPSSQPSIVRLGVVDFSNAEEMEKRVEIPIRTVHIHPRYTNSRSYNDIALLELSEDATYSDLIYPTCLYTEAEDPSPNATLHVTGWGTVNTATRAYSDILLKARLEIEPLGPCNQSYAEAGFGRQLTNGVLDTQLCAHDVNLTMDACQGDSGGPLVMVVDESRNNYRAVGIISTGFSCASATPGLFTRVSSYLDYIEDIVWPNGV